MNWNCCRQPPRVFIASGERRKTTPANLETVLSVVKESSSPRVWMLQFSSKEAQAHSYGSEQKRRCVCENNGKVSSLSPPRHRSETTATGLGIVVLVIMYLYSYPMIYYFEQEIEALFIDRIVQSCLHRNCKEAKRLCMDKGVRSSSFCSCLPFQTTAAIISHNTE